MLEVMREKATKSTDYLSEWPRGFYWDSNRHTKNSLESLHQPGAATAPPSAQLSSGPLGGPLGPQRVSQ